VVIPSKITKQNVFWYLSYDIERFSRKYFLLKGATSCACMTCGIAAETGLT
jgi:hypothetical protein